MKKLLCFILMMMFTIPCFAATYKIISTKQTEDILVVTVKYVGTGINKQVEIPIFHPPTKEYVTTAIKNRFYTLKSKYDASEQIKVIKPSVDQDIGNPMVIN